MIPVQQQTEADCDMLDAENRRKLVEMHYGTHFKENLW